MISRGAVLLDLDGTLIDSAPDLLATLNTLLTENRRRTLSLDEIIPLIGDGIGALVARAMRETGGAAEPPELRHLVERFLEIYLDPDRPQLTRVYDNVPATLVAIRQDGHRLAVCTNKVEEAASSLLRQLGLYEFVDAVVGGDKVTAQKPHPAHVQAALERLEAAAGSAVMVGDSRNDIAAGAAAGTATIAVTYGYGDVATIVPRPTRTIDRFDDLPAVLRDLRTERFRRVPPPGG